MEDSDKEKEDVNEIEYFTIEQMKDIDDMEVYQNIQNSELHSVVAKSSIFPYLEIISWVLPRVNVEERLIRDMDESKVITSFQPSNFDIYHKFSTPKVHLTKEWIAQVQLDIYACIKRWWMRGKYSNPRKRVAPTLPRI